MIKRFDCISNKAVICVSLYGLLDNNKKFLNYYPCISTIDDILDEILKLMKARYND